MQNEIWKDIPNFYGYQISNYGRIKSIDRDIVCGDKTIHCNGKILKQSKNQKGYLRIRISKGRNKKYTLLIHRLVALAFIENPNNYQQINHIDGNKENNYYLNLEWCNNSQNQIHAVKLGLNDHNKYNAGRKRKMVAQIDINSKKIIYIYNSLSEAANQLNIERSQIGKVCNGNRKTCGGFLWKFANNNMRVGDVVDRVGNSDR